MQVIEVYVSSQGPCCRFDALMMLGPMSILPFLPRSGSCFASSYGYIHLYMEDATLNWGLWTRFTGPENPSQSEASDVACLCGLKLTGDILTSWIIFSFSLWDESQKCILRLRFELDTSLR